MFDKVSGDSEDMFEGSSEVLSNTGSASWNIEWYQNALLSLISGASFPVVGRISVSILDIGIGFSELIAYHAGNML